MADVFGLDHVGIAVRDLDEAVETFSELLGRDAEAWRDEDGRELDDEGNVLEEFRFAYLETGNGVAIELMEPGEVGRGAIGSFVEKHGEGIHHISFWVSPKGEFGEFFETLTAMGFTLVGDEPWRSDPDAERDNVYTYVHPSDAHGTLVEFITPYRFEDGRMISLDEPPETVQSNVELSETLTDRVAEYAEANGITSDEAYRDIIQAGLEAVEHPNS